MINIYFAGAIRGGREKVNTYIKINDVLKQYGKILDEHVANPNVDKLEKNISLENIYTRDVNWIKESDLLVAEVSTPSLGVGYELCYAEKLGIPVIVLYDENINVSAMIKGNSYFEIISYKNDEDLINKLNYKLNKIITDNANNKAKDFPRQRVLGKAELVYCEEKFIPWRKGYSLGVVYDYDPKNLHQFKLYNFGYCPSYDEFYINECVRLPKKLIEHFESTNIPQDQLEKEMNEMGIPYLKSFWMLIQDYNDTTKDKSVYFERIKKRFWDSKNY